MRYSVLAIGVDGDAVFVLGDNQRQRLAVFGSSVRWTQMAAAGPISTS